ncbi:MAG: ATP-dependent sacrificial sulfur transferase LarE, partial [Candidatus Omnitrophota bacterium]
KKELFLDLLKIAKRKKIPYIVEASNLDDLKDFRPGLRAVKEAGVRSPLIEAGFTKKNIREASKKLGLPTYNKPPFACLASRIPYGEEITKERLLRIEKAERFLKNLGLFQVRVRDHKEICRIEVGESDFSKVLKNRRKITNFLQKLGYIFVSLDLRGYKPGSMNRLLR